MFFWEVWDRMARMNGGFKLEGCEQGQCIPESTTVHIDRYAVLPSDENTFLSGGLKSYDKGCRHTDQVLHF